MITPATEILNQKGTPMFNSDLFANRPAAGIAGRIFISTDTKEFYRDTGSTWELIGGPGAGTVTGNGTINVLPIWTSTTGIGNSSISEDATFIFSSKSIKSNAFITNGGTSSQFVKGDGTLDSSTYVSGSGSSTRIAFWSGTNSLTSSNNLFWDNTNGYLGINTNTPGAAIDAHGVNIIAQLNGITNSNAQLAFQSNGTGKWRLGNVYSAGSNYFRIEDIDSGLERIKLENIGLLTLTASQKIDGNGLGSGGYLAFKQFASTQASDIGYTGLSALSTDIFSLSFYQSGTGGGAIYRTIRFSAASIANSATRTFTFPNASGTIAITSDLGAYLPLTGGTLTGGLNGTSASFSSSVSAIGLFGYVLRGRASDNYGAFGFYSNDGATRYGYIQSHSTNGGQLNITGDGGGQIIFDSRGVVMSTDTSVQKENGFFSVDSTGSNRIGFTKQSGSQPWLTFASDPFVIASSNGTNISASNTFTFRALMPATTGNLILGSPFTDNGNRLQVNGIASISSGLTIGTNSLPTDRMFQVSGFATTSGTTQYACVTNPTFASGSNIYGHYIAANTNFNATNRYGLFIDDPVGTATNDYAIYSLSSRNNYFNGRIGIRNNNPSGLLSVNDAVYGEYLRVAVGLIGGNQTSLYLAWNNGGTITLQQVVVGAADSGGTGFRLLRIPNT